MNREQNIFELGDKVKIINKQNSMANRTGVVASIVYKKGTANVYDIGVDMHDEHNSSVDIMYFQAGELQKIKTHY